MLRSIRHLLHRLLAVLYPEHDARFKSPCSSRNGDDRTAGDCSPRCDATGWTLTAEQIENREKWNRGALPGCRQGKAIVELAILNPPK